MAYLTIKYYPGDFTFTKGHEALLGYLSYLYIIIIGSYKWCFILETGYDNNSAILQILKTIWRGYNCAYKQGESKNLLRRKNFYIDEIV